MFIIDKTVIQSVSRVHYRKSSLSEVVEFIIEKQSFRVLVEFTIEKAVFQR